MTSHWEPHREPFRQTLYRTVTIALVAGAVLARAWGGLTRWPMATLLMLWPSFGGHWVELWFLNWLRPRLSRLRGVQLVARLAVWFVAGSAFILAMRLTADALRFPPIRRTPWWFGGIAFIVIELLAHAVLQLRGRPSFFNARS